MSEAMWINAISEEHIAEELIKRSKDKNIIYLTDDVILNTDSVKLLANYISKQQKEIEKLKNQNKTSAIEHEKAFNKFDKMIDLMLDDMNLNGNPKQEVYRSYENRAISILKQVEVEDEK